MTTNQQRIELRNQVRNFWTHKIKPYLPQGTEFDFFKTLFSHSNFAFCWNFYESLPAIFVDIGIDHRVLESFDNQIKGILRMTETSDNRELVRKFYAIMMDRKEVRSHRYPKYLERAKQVCRQTKFNHLIENKMSDCCDDNHEEKQSPTAESQQQTHSTAADCNNHYDSHQRNFRLNDAIMMMSLISLQHDEMKGRVSFQHEEVKGIVLFHHNNIKFMHEEIKRELSIIKKEMSKINSALQEQKDSVNFKRKKKDSMMHS